MEWQCVGGCHLFLRRSYWASRFDGFYRANRNYWFYWPSRFDRFYWADRTAGKHRHNRAAGKYWPNWTPGSNWATP